LSSVAFFGAVGEVGRPDLFGFLPGRKKGNAEGRNHELRCPRRGFLVSGFLPGREKGNVGRGNHELRCSAAVDGLLDIFRNVRKATEREETVNCVAPKVQYW